MKPSPQLLAAVSENLQPVRPILRPAWRAWGIVFPLSILAVVGVFYWAGLRRDTARLGPILAWGASLAQVVLGILLVWIAARESTPGQRLPKTLVRSTLVAAGVLVVAVSMWTFYARPVVIPPRFSALRSAIACGTNETKAGILLVLLIAVLLGRRTLAARPALVGALCGAAAGIVVNAGWRLSCPVSEPSHALLGHGIPVLIITLAGAIVVSLIARLRNDSAHK